MAKMESGSTNIPAHLEQTRRTWHSSRLLIH